MQGLKSAILAIFQKSADWLDWPCPVSAALHFRPQKMAGNGCISFYQSIMNQNDRQNLCLVLCCSDPYPSSVNTISTRRDRLCPPHHYWQSRIFRSPNDHVCTDNTIAPGAVLLSLSNHVACNSEEYVNLNNSCLAAACHGIKILTHTVILEYFNIKE